MDGETDTIAFSFSYIGFRPNRCDCFHIPYVKMYFFGIGGLASKTNTTWTQNELDINEVNL